MENKVYLKGQLKRYYYCSLNGHLFYILYLPKIGGNLKSPVYDYIKNISNIKRIILRILLGNTGQERNWTNQNKSNR